MITNEQRDAVLDWMTQVTHAIAELRPGNAVALLDSLSQVKTEFGIEQSIGETIEA